MVFFNYPSVGLITTLFRLGLNVSSTRLILSEGGDAGMVIKSFGTLITQGNIVIGILIFLIIVLVQFIVITKGAERVSEVAARFTLDAMPGKQMAIDADLSSGLKPGCGVIRSRRRPTSTAPWTAQPRSSRATPSCR